MKQKIQITKEYLIENYCNKNKSMTQISKEIGCAYSSVNRFIKLYGIHPRTNGESKIKNISGQRFGELIAIEPAAPGVHCYGWKIPRWICLCDCGEKYEAIYAHLRDKKTTSCYKCAFKKTRIHNELSGTFWRQIVQGAKKRNIEVSVNKKTVYELFIKQNKKCGISGLPIEMAETTKDHCHGKTTASLDRIDSLKGYHIDNICWVHKDINKIKWNLQINYFLFLCICTYFSIYDKNKIHCKDIETKKLLMCSFNRYKRNAKNRNIDFKIDIEYAKYLFKQQSHKCAITGLPIYFVTSWQDQHTKIKNTASLDRIDSNQGYIEGNVQWVHKDINRMKNDLNQDYFLHICKCVAENITEENRNSIFKLFSDRF